MLQRPSNEKGNLTHFPLCLNIGAILFNATKPACQFFHVTFHWQMYNVSSLLWSSAYMPGTLPNASHMLSHLIPPTTPLLCNFFPILQIRKLKLGKMSTTNCRKGRIKSKSV